MALPINNNLFTVARVRILALNCLLILIYVSLWFEKVGRNKTSHQMQLHIQFSGNQTVPVRAERSRFNNEDDDGYVKAVR